MMLMWFLVAGMLVALGAGVYVGLGAPGTRGRQDRVVMHGRPKRLQRRHIDWLRPRR
jgi:Uri superfamily endonuclease